MNKLNQLAKVALNEAPLSSYIKSIGSKVLNPAAYARGAGKILRGAGKAVGAFQTSSKTLSQSLGTAGNVATGIGGGLSKTGQWIKDPGYTGKTKSKETKQATPQSQQTQLQQKAQQMPADLAKTKTNLEINGTQLPTKYAGQTANGYPVYRVSGIPWAKSIVVEPGQKNRAVLYMFADKKPNLKKRPAAIRPGILFYSGVQNILTIVTK